MRFALGLVATLALAAATGCTDIEPGMVGLRVHKTGAQRGVEHTPYYGRVYAAYNVDLIEFPITVQNVVWSRAPHEGSPTDESITFTVAHGITVNADVGLNFKVDPLKAYIMYTRYHQIDLNVLADGQLRNDVRDCLGDNAAGLTIDEFLGDGRARLLDATLRCVQGNIGQYGLLVENLSFVSAPRIPENVQRAINDSLAAQQHMVQAEAQARAELATAEGHARAVRAEAQGAADAMLTRTRADVENRHLMAQAYREMQPTLTPEVLRYLTIQHWNGHLAPSYGSNSVFSVPSVTP